jgi:hypothetical protein
MLQHQQRQTSQRNADPENKSDQISRKEISEGIFSVDDSADDQQQGEHYTYD